MITIIAMIHNIPRQVSEQWPSVWWNVVHVHIRSIWVALQFNANVLHSKLHPQPLIVRQDGVAVVDKVEDCRTWKDVVPQVCRQDTIAELGSTKRDDRGWRHVVGKLPVGSIVDSCK